MNITIEAANNTATIHAARSVREQVFGKACCRRLPRLDAYDPEQILTLVARATDTNEPVAVLTVVETTADSALHRSLDLPFPDNALVARYTQMAVLEAYRGMRVPLSMILEARRRFILPKRIAYTWLLCDADAARSSSFCTDLGFKPSAQVFATEYGRSRVLVRKEVYDYHAPELANSVSSHRLAASPSLPALCVFPRAMFEDEWLSQ